MAKLSMAVGFAVLLAPQWTLAQKYIQTNLVTDPRSGIVANNKPDANLKNAWGMARSTTGPWSISDNATGLSTLYDGAGDTLGLVVKIPGPNGSAPDFVASPTGTVANGSPDFDLTPGDAKTAAAFIFVTKDGTISAWAGGNVATLKVDNSAVPNAKDGAVYKGVTFVVAVSVRIEIAKPHAHEARVIHFDVTGAKIGHVEVSFSLKLADRFRDERIPKGFAPFNVQNIGGSIFVTYAKQNDVKHDDVAGDGNGFVDIFSPSGELQARLEHGPWLNSPWGAVWTPRDFGEFSNRVLIGNFGNGKISAFNGFDGRFIGLMKDDMGNVLQIDGLWGLTFGNSAIGCPSTPPAGSGLPKYGQAGPYNSLFFTAGPNG